VSDSLKDVYILGGWFGIEYLLHNFTMKYIIIKTKAEEFNTT